MELSSLSLNHYLRDVRAFPILSLETEQELCFRWRDHHDITAAHELVGSHLRLVVKTARAYRGYGLPQEDLIGEGHIGLMRAVCRFDPRRGVRFATYAIWWVRAAILEYVMHNWSVVKIATTGAQKRLFFNLLRMRSNLHEFDNGMLRSENASQIAKALGVSERDVISMSQRMAAPDASLNVPIKADNASEWQDQLVDDNEDQETLLAEREEVMRRESRLPPALKRLTTRERQIIIERHLKDRPTTLEDLSQRFRVSPERIRQIEMRAMTKLKRSLYAPPAWQPSDCDTEVADAPARRALQ
jgi:RNA polymerase sigma-32 factor